MLEIPVRDYQLDVANRVSGEWKKGNKRVVLVLSTGGGKSRIAMYMIAKAILKGKRVLFLAHRRRLIQQIAELAQQFQVPYGVVMATLPDAEKGPWVIRNGTAPLQIASRDTLIARAVRTEREGIPPHDLLIVDEVHSLGSREYLNLANVCGAEYWIGLTATPVRPDGNGLGISIFDTMVVGIGMKELIAQVALVPVKVYSPVELGKKRKQGEKTGIAGDPIDHWKRHANGMSTIVFCSKVDEANAIRDRYRKIGVTAECMHAKTEQTERDDIFGLVNDGKVTVVTNAFLCSEGVDVPKWQCCQLLRKCESLIQYLQCCGRVMRPYPGKEYAVILDHTGAAIRHGLPEEDRPWALSDGFNIDKQRKRDLEDGKASTPFVCRNCGTMFAGSPVCPECKMPLPRKERKEDPKLANEALVQISGEQLVEHKSNQMNAEWQRLLFIAAATGKQCRVPYSQFKAKFGVAPDKAGMRPVLSFDDREAKVSEVLPQYIRKKKS